MPFAEGLGDATHLGQGGPVSNDGVVVVGVVVGLALVFAGYLRRRREVTRGLLARQDARHEARVTEMLDGQAALRSELVAAGVLERVAKLPDKPYGPLLAAIDHAIARAEDIDDGVSPEQSAKHHALLRYLFKHVEGILAPSSGMDRLRAALDADAATLSPAERATRKASLLSLRARFLETATNAMRVAVPPAATAEETKAPVHGPLDAAKNEQEQAHPLPLRGVP